MTMLKIIDVIGIFLIVQIKGNVKVRDCEPITITLCKSLGYNYTAMPNLVGHENQQDAEFQLSTFQPLIQYGCSRHLQFFLCSAYAPMCTEKLVQTLGPCRPMCQHVKTNCQPVLNEFGFPWPMALNCSKFPEMNDATTMCMMPDGVVPDDEPSTRKPPRHSGDASHMASDPPPDASSHNIASLQNECTSDGRGKYVYNNDSDAPRCALRCDEHELFTEQDKHFAQIFISVFSILCLILTMFTVLTFLIDLERINYPDRLVVLVAFCYMLCCTAYVVRLGIGRQATICQIDRHTNVHIVVSDGLQNPYCVIIFLLLYYFGSASQLWCVVLAVWWLLVAGLRWSDEAVHRYSTRFHLAAWAVPALKTILVLLLRYVAPDQLTGLCYVGNSNRNHLTAFVISPLLIYLLVALSLFIAGIVALFRNRRRDEHDCGKAETIDSLFIKICVFLSIYVLASACVVGCYIYEFSHIQHWNKTQTPNIEVFMLKIVSFLAPGFAAGLWSWNAQTVQSWQTFGRRVFRCSRNPNKTVNIRHTKCPQTQYHMTSSTAHVNIPHTKCPQTQYHMTSSTAHQSQSVNNSYQWNSSYNSYEHRAPSMSPAHNSYEHRAPSLSPAHNSYAHSNFYNTRALLDGGESVII